MDKNFFFYLIEAILAVVILYFIGMPVLRKLKARQSIREEGPKAHRAKSGTPTMGGIFMIISFIAVSVMNGLISAQSVLFLFVAVGHGFLGFLDDFIKARKKRNLGLTAKEKLLGQLFLSVVFCYGVVEILKIPTAISIPFLNYDISLGWLYYPFVVLVIIGASNAVNLTDGLDGLASGCCTIAFAAYSAYCYLSGYIDLSYMCLIVVGCCVGFLFFNYNPAKVFMGDTGSLFLGGTIAAVSVLTRSELLLILFGFIFVIEALSVIIQVTSFKLYKKRIFKMSPIHHHFELSGWKETKVVWVFWIFEFFIAFGTLFMIINNA